MGCVRSTSSKRPAEQRWRCAGTGLELTLASLFLVGIAFPVDARAQSAGATPEFTRETVVEPGDTWTALRIQFCPIEIFEAANPELANRPLQPGDRVRSPFVPAAELERANDANAELEASLAREMDRSAELEERVTALSALEGELVDARTAHAESERLRSWLLFPLVAGFALFAIAAGVAVLLRVEGTRAQAQLGKTDVELAELRRSLQGLEAQMQKRVLELIAQHKGQSIGEEAISRTSRPVIELAERIRRRHAS